MKKKKIVTAKSEEGTRVGRVRAGGAACEDAISFKGHGHARACAVNACDVHVCNVHARSKMTTLLLPVSATAMHERPSPHLPNATPLGEEKPSNPRHASGPPKT